MLKLLLLISYPVEPDFFLEENSQVLAMQGVPREAVPSDLRGYVLEVESFDEFAKTLSDAAIEVRSISAAVASRHAFHLTREVQPNTECPLTSREHNVLQLLAQGDSYECIADALAIGLGTVQSHVKNLYRKLGVTNKIEATRVAHRSGWLQS